MNRIIFFLAAVSAYFILSCSLGIDPGSDEGQEAWSNVGVQGGIPEYPVGVNVKDGPYLAQGDGVTDDTRSILDAIDNCPEEHAVYLPAGSYRITGTIQFEKSIVLRGAGPDLTEIIHTQGDSGIHIGPYDADLPSDLNGAGLEDFHLVTAVNFNNGGTRINLNGVHNSWVKNIRTSGYAYTGIRLNRTTHCEVRECFVQSTYEYVDWYAPGGEVADSYGILCGGGLREGLSSCNLVENNIVDWYRHALTSGTEASNNVIGYNFCWTNWNHVQSETHCYKLHHPDYDDPSRIVTYTLGEGNVFEMGDAHGWHQNNTLFRNRIMGGGLMFGLVVHPNNSAIGNEFTKHKHPSYNLDNLLNAMEGSIAHGNYVTDGDGIQWDPSIEDQTIPDSYYLSGRPEWFGDLDWPCYGGDLMPGNTRRNPAEVRYWTMLFPEEAPTGLHADVQGNEIELSWAHSPNTGNPASAIDYIICRSSNGSDYHRIGDTDQTVYTDNVSDTGQYWYYVRARNHLGGISGNEQGGESGASGVILITVQ